MEITSDSVSFFFVVGIIILLISCVASLWPVWHKGLTKFQENDKSIWPIAWALILTLGMGSGIVCIFVDQGTAFEGENVDLQGPVEVREDFVKAHAEEKADVQPLTKKDLQEKRLEDQKTKEAQEKAEKAEKEKDSTESMQDFRKRVMNRSETE